MVAVELSEKTGTTGGFAIAFLQAWARLWVDTHTNQVAKYVTVLHAHYNTRGIMDKKGMDDGGEGAHEVVQRCWVWFREPGSRVLDEGEGPQSREQCLCTRQRDSLTLNMTGSGSVHYIPLPFPVLPPNQILSHIKSSFYR